MPLIDLVCKKNADALPVARLVGTLLPGGTAGRSVRKPRAGTVHAKSSVLHGLRRTVLRVHPSVHAAYRAREDGLNVSAALYDKLRGVETGVSSALVRETARDLEQVQDALGVRREAWLPGHAIRILDGNCLEAGEKRLGVHRGVGGDGPAC